MLKRHENKFRMFHAVKQVLDRNSALWQGIVALAAIITEFYEKLTQIEATRQITEGTTTGTTREKNDQEELLVDRIYEISSAVYAMAVRTGNSALQQKAGYNESELQTAREGELAAIGESVSAIARQNLAALADYGIDEGTLTSFDELNKGFKDMVSTPRADIAGRKAANAKLKEQFDETTALLENQLDRLMVRFKNSQPEFYTVYMNARALIEHGIRHEKKEGQAETVSPN